MRARIFVTLITLMLGAPALAAPRCDALLASRETERVISHVYLWKIERGGKAAFVLGTIHAGIQLANFPAWFHRDVMAKSKTFVLEADLRRGLTADLAQMRLPADITLTSLIGFKAADQTASLLPEFERSDLERTKPFFLALAIKGSPMRNFSPGIDEDIFNKVKLSKRGKLRYLETAEFLMNYLDQGPATDSLLKELARTPAERLAEFRKQVLEYAAGSYRLDPHYAANEHGGKLVYRHVHWINEIVRLFDTEPDLLIAVGLNHLLAEGSVLDLLAERGFKITRYTSPTPP